MHPETPLFVTGYSYKGGSGRTTTGMNLALTLSSLGHYVVLIDADLGAGGVRSIWREMSGDALSESDGRLLPREGVHTVLERRSDPRYQGLGDEYYRHWDFWANAPGYSVRVPAAGRGAGEIRVEVDTRREGHAVQRYRAECLDDKGGQPGVTSGIHAWNDKRFMAGELLVIPGAEGQYMPSGVASGEVDGLVRCYRELAVDGLRYLRGKTRRTHPSYADARSFVLVDAASGITPNSIPALQLADIIMVFFRKSIQHHQGTRINLPGLLRHLDSQRQHGPEQGVMLAATCVSEDQQRFLQAVTSSSGTALRLSYEAIGNFWQDVKDYGGAEEFGRVVEYLGEFPEHPMLRAREIGAPFYGLFDLTPQRGLLTGDAASLESVADRAARERWSGAHIAYARMCATVAARLESEHEEWPEYG